MDNPYPLYATESGGSWGKPKEISDPDNGAFFGVSCTGTGECTAVGADSTNDLPMYATETGGSWGAPTDIDAPGGYGVFNGVSCTGTGECTAVGGDLDGPIYDTESGGIWGAPTLVPSSNVSDGETGVFLAVSCTGIGECTGVGSADEDPTQPMYATESGGVWGDYVDLPSSGSDPILRSVSCTGIGECSAVGTTGGPDATSQPIYATETEGNWNAVTELPYPKEGEFWGVSCAGAGECTAVGDGYDSSSSPKKAEPIYATESEGIWGSATGVPAPDNGFRAVSCTEVGVCTAAGYDTPQHPIYSFTSSSPAPTILTFAPGSGGVGETVTIKGTNLNGASQVIFNKTTGTITRDTATKLKVKVPSGATTGYITVVTPGGQVKSATKFSVT